MIHWEYQTASIVIDTHHIRDVLQSEITDMQANGWELVSMAPSSYELRGSGHFWDLLSLLLVFRRPRPEEEP
jgi:hypothetical protein